MISLVSLPDLGTRPGGTSNDPRYLRTSAVIYSAFAELLTSNTMEAISVQMIAKQARINRATFYDHFPTKYHLYDEYVRHWFRSLVTASFAGKPERRPEGLGCLILATMEALTTISDRCRLTTTTEPIAYSTIQQEIHDFVTDWLQHQTNNKEMNELAAATSASSWAIFGSALEWSRSAQDCNPQKRADEIRNLVMEGLTSMFNIGVTRPDRPLTV
jgi:AcrR family transcriptional regulator